jgi:hypothetical protein
MKLLLRLLCTSALGTTIVAVTSGLAGAKTGQCANL